MNEDFRGAYERLVDAQQLPGDVVDQVHELVGRRRRRRRRATTATAVAAVAVVAAALVGAYEPGGRTNARDTIGPAEAIDSPAPADPSPAADNSMPTPISCADGKITEADLDSPGYDLFSDLLAEWSGQHGAYRIDDAGRRLMFIRADGTAHAQLSFTLDRDRRWFPTAARACADSKTTQTPATVAPLPSLAAYDFIGCSGRTPLDSVVRADVTDPLSSPGAGTTEQAAMPYKKAYDLIETYRLDERRAIAPIVGPSDGVALALSLVADQDQQWHIAGLAGCAGTLPGLQPSPTSTTLTALELGHCWVEPFTYGGQTWLPPYDRQFGTGGLGPNGFLGIGTATIDGNSLRFTDASGAQVDMIPASAPDADLTNKLCD